MDLAQQRLVALLAFLDRCLTLSLAGPVAALNGRCAEKALLPRLVQGGVLLDAIQSYTRQLLAQQGQRDLVVSTARLIDAPDRLQHRLQGIGGCWPLLRGALLFRDSRRGDRRRLAGLAGEHGAAGDPWRAVQVAGAFLDLDWL